MKCEERLAEAVKMISLLEKKLDTVNLKYNQLAGVLRKKANEDRTQDCLSKERFLTGYVDGADWDRT